MKNNFMNIKKISIMAGLAICFLIKDVYVVEAEETSRYVSYVKNHGISQINLSSEDKLPEDFENTFNLEGNGSYPVIVTWGDLGGGVQYSPDKSYVCYPEYDVMEDNNEDSSLFTLYKHSNLENGETELIASDVQEYRVISDDAVLYIDKNNSLYEYLSDGKRTLIASGVAGVLGPRDKKDTSGLRYYWYSYDKDAEHSYSGLWYTDANEIGIIRMVFSDFDSFIRKKDSGQIYFIRGDELLISDGIHSPQPVLDNIDEILRIYEDDTILYSVKSDSDSAYISLKSEILEGFDENSASSDEKKVYEIVKSNLKMLDEMLDVYDNDDYNNTFALYKWKDGKSDLVQECCTKISTDNDGSGNYVMYDFWDFENFSINQFCKEYVSLYNRFLQLDIVDFIEEDIFDPDIVYDFLESQMTRCGFCNSNYKRNLEFDLGYTELLYIDKPNGLVYGMNLNLKNISADLFAVGTTKETENILYTYSISDIFNLESNPEICGIKDGVFYYTIEDVLYANQIVLDYDVDAESVFVSEDAVYYKANLEYLDSEGAYTLRRYKDGKNEIIARMVNKKWNINESDFLLLADFELNSERGNLYYYHEGNLEYLDTDVSRLLTID